MCKVIEACVMISYVECVMCYLLDQQWKCMRISMCKENSLSTGNETDLFIIGFRNWIFLKHSIIRLVFISPYNNHLLMANQRASKHLKFSILKPPTFVKISKNRSVKTSSKHQQLSVLKVKSSINVK